MVASVADVLVTIVARRASFAGVAHRVRQKRPPPDAEWLERESPGICSQHSPVLQDRPAPEIESSPPISLICTAPPPPPCPRGLGPHASPQSPIAHDSLTPLAV